MTLKYHYIALFFSISIAISIGVDNIQESSSYTLITKKATATAGDLLELKFSFKGSADVSLYCSNSYGSIILNPTVTENELIFKIPFEISKKSGILNWKLIADNTELNGQINIMPKTSVKTLESYLGPPSIEAGGTDYTMLVVIPTDDLDNALADSTKVSIKHQFLDNENSSEVFTSNGFGYKNIYSEPQSGRILISSESLELNSKEYDVNVMPAIPTDFEISADRVHTYADGNQIVTFTTSILKDHFNNTVSDGTFVTFFITNKDGYKATTSATTLNGKATAKIIHPDHEDQWTVKAYVEGIADSQSISLNFKQAISDFDVALSRDKRTITVGPLKSFMSQRVPDGLLVKLLIYKNGKLEEQLIESSFNGLANFNLNKDRFPKGNYRLDIQVAGMTKTISDIIYE